MIFHPRVSASYTTTPSTGGRTVGRQVINNGAKFLWLHGRNRLETMWQQHVDGDVGWIQQIILVRLILWEGRVAISEAEGFKLNKLAHKGNAIMPRGSSLVYLKIKILNFAIAFKKWYYKKVVETCNVDKVKNMMCFDLLIGISAQFYHRYIQAARIALRHDSFLSLVENLDVDDSASKIWEYPFEWDKAVHGNHGGGTNAL